MKNIVNKFYEAYVNYVQSEEMLDFWLDKMRNEYEDTIIKHDDEEYRVLLIDPKGENRDCPIVLLHSVKEVSMNAHKSLELTIDEFCEILE